MNDTDAGQWPRGDGEMAGRIRAFDWSGSPLGGIETWTDRCHSVVDMVLASGFPAVVLVGPELIQIYNDGYCAIMGDKHPAGLGQPTRDCWPEVWHINAPIYRRVAGGETVTFQDALYPIRRDGALEDAWFTLSYSPLRERDGTVADILVTVVETSERVRSRNALQDSEARFRAFVNASSDVVYRMTPIGRRCGSSTGVASWPTRPRQAKPGSTATSVPTTSRWCGPRLPMRSARRRRSSWSTG